MRLIGFNQTGGKVTGNIENLEITSVQNKSTTTGISSGINVGVSSSGLPNSESVNHSKTNGNRTYVDKQSTFILGEGSNLTVGKATNTGAIVGTTGNNSSLKVKEYVGKDLYNTDKLTTTGGSVGTGGVGFNQEKHDKEGITRNTVIGNVEIGTSKGSPINTDLSKANETIKDTHRNTNIYVEDNTIKAVSNSKQFVEDFNIAVLEGKATVEGAIKKIDNILNGSDDSDISQAEKRRYEEIKEDILRVKTAPEIELIAKGDLSNKEIQDKLGIGGKIDLNDPNLPKSVKERIEHLKKRNPNEKIDAFYDQITGKIYINKDINKDDIRSGIAREWVIREGLESGRGKKNDEGKLKATVAGEIAENEIKKRRKDKPEKLSPEDFDYGKLLPESEITSDKVTPEDLKRMWNGLVRGAENIGSKLVKLDGKGAKEELDKVGKKIGKNIQNEINEYKQENIERKKKQEEELKNKINQANYILGRNYQGRYTVKNGVIVFHDSESKKNFEKEAKKLGVSNYFKTSVKNLMKEENVTNLTELREYQSLRGDIPKGTKIILRYEGGDRVFNSLEDFMNETPEEAAIIEFYSQNINKEKDPIKRNSLEKEQDNFIKAIQLRRAPMGKISTSGDLAQSAIRYEKGKLIIDGEKYYKEAELSKAAAAQSYIETVNRINGYRSPKEDKLPKKDTSQSEMKENIQQRYERVRTDYENRIKNNYNNLSEQEKEMFEKYEKNGWKGQVSGGPERAGKIYRNDGRYGSQVLPGQGEIEYREFDINVTTGGRDSYRFVRGSDGSVYYTDDHYMTFKRIK